MRMDSLVIPWVLSGVSVAFVFGCVEYNRRTGFKKIRTVETPLEDALLWINTTRASLSPIPAARMKDIERAEASTQQLIRLYAAYNPGTSPKATPLTRAQIPPDVVGEYALAQAR